MKTFHLPRTALLGLLLLSTFGLGAEPKSAWDRSLSFLSGGLYWDPSDPSAGPGVSLQGEDFHYLNPDSPNGFYTGFLTSASFHQRGSQVSVDDHLVTVGFWGSLGAGSPFSWTANISPVLGSRSDGSVLLGSYYWGISTTLGVFYDLLPGLGLGITWAPVYNLTSNGRPQAPDQSYQEFSLVLVIKQLSLSRPWEEGLK